MRGKEFEQKVILKGKISRGSEKKYGIEDQIASRLLPLSAFKIGPLVPIKTNPPH